MPRGVIEMPRQQFQSNTPMSVSISVVVPCYNGRGSCGRPSNVCFGQTHAAHEIIVVDDGSTDNSAAIAASFGPPVRLIRQENKGEGGRANTGAAAATGSHLFFLDADDLIEPDALERLNAAATGNPGAMILMRSIAFDDESGRATSEPSTRLLSSSQL